ncbi:phage tail protein [Collimonas sp. NPDC087041]|uniref:phage tail protein n=1 Tax=Collimonas sp. NPDC087041 TaxID=3363960 RepID=UPI0038193110
MTNIVEERDFKAGIYELATDDDVVGGPGGIANRQAAQLAARTNYLKDHVDALENGDKAANKASKLATARKISLVGDVSGSVSFDGTGDVEMTIKYKTSGIEAGTYRQVTVDAKGNVTGGSNPTTLAGYGLTDAAPLDSPAFTGDPTARTQPIGSNNKSLANMEALQQVAALASPAGMTAYFAMSTAPAGWLKANGAAISRAAYAALFAAIGTRFGAGDNNTTFNLPDLRGEFIRGFDEGRGADSGRVFGSGQAEDFRMHSHGPLGIVTASGGVPGSSGAGIALGGSNYWTSNTTAGTGGTETRPRNVALLACIKY